MEAVMIKGVHYGVIPGTSKGDGEDDKPTLYQPGADKLCLMFRLRVDYEFVEKIEQDDWIAVTVRARLYHINTGLEWGSGVGSANSREKKYLATTTAKTCPRCKKPTIIRSKFEDAGWYCFPAKGGCKAKFAVDDKEIADQKGDAIKEGVWDLHNTLLKMAQKRAKVAAVLTATAASDVFTQDLEDLADKFDYYAVPPGQAQGPKPEAKEKEKPRASSAQLKNLSRLLSHVVEDQSKVFEWCDEQLGRRVNNDTHGNPDFTQEEAEKLIHLATNLMEAARKNGGRPVSGGAR